MRKITSKELRKEWINFYVERGHKDCGAVSLVSDGSTGAMFNVAGMQPIMPYLLGKKHPLGTRLCNVQGCVRTNDIDSVGDKAHLTFFEMMGSWSLGDYFKKERCQWSYELLTQVFEFDKDHLAATVFEGDENAPRDEEGAKYRIESGFKKENVFFLPAEDNWWGLEYGPCGPDSEMFFISDKAPCGPDCRPGCSCGKYTEVGNDVFMQYDKQKDGTLLPLSKKNVDTGWGLERNLAFLNGVDDVYKTDLFVNVIAYIEKASGINYGEDEKATKSMRVIADHLRTGVMLIGDEAKLLPSNTGAGYVLRRIIRRAVRHGRAISLKTEDLLKVASIYIDEVYDDSYPLLTKNREFILDELKKEIVRFETTLENGMKEYKKIADELNTKGVKVIDGKSAFYLYDTFGFPIELTEEMASEDGMTVDAEGFAKAMDEQKTKAREHQNFSANLSTNKDLFEALDKDTVTEFVGYDSLEAVSKVAALADVSSLKDSLKEGEEGTVVTLKTPFYATMGGQKGDKGVIRTSEGEFEVTDTVKLGQNRIGHIGRVIRGNINVDSEAKLEVCKASRKATCRNHSATHLLQKALQEVLGSHVEQQGSYQDTERTRFDFSHSSAMTPEEIQKVEKIVNEKIQEEIDVVTKVMGLEEAKKEGAMALFGEKYGESVRVVCMGEFSKELCGGTHVSNTRDIMNFKILSESGVAAGVRRIEALTGTNVISYFENIEKNMNDVCAVVKATPAQLLEKVTSMSKDIKEMSSQIESLKAKAAKDSLKDVENSIADVKGVKLLATKVSGVDMNGLRDLADQLKTKLGDGVIVLISSLDAKVNMVAMATEGAMSKGAHAGNLIKGIASKVGGGGGGKPSMAQAGGKNPEGIDDAIKEAAIVLATQINN